jgi:transcription elongation factor
MHSGEYQNDLALVLEVDGEHVCLALIPRISMSVKSSEGKRKLSSLSRPAQQLFDENKVIEVYGEDSVTKCNTLYKFKDQNFRNGLLELDTTLPDLVQERACPTTAELHLFAESFHKFSETPTVQMRFIDLAFARKLAAALRPDDPVVIVTGIMKGTAGKFKTIDGVDQDKIAIEISDDSPRHSYIVHLSISDVERYFQVGDFVKVKEGSNVGCSGWVVSYNRPHVTFYDMATSCEVRIPSYCFIQKCLTSC